MYTCRYTRYIPVAGGGEVSSMFQWMLVRFCISTTFNKPTTVATWVFTMLGLEGCPSKGQQQVSR